jgi:hypothetical protein
MGGVSRLRSACGFLDSMGNFFPRLIFDILRFAFVYDFDDDACLFFWVNA